MNICRAKSKYAPIIVFVYNRPDHTKRLIESIKVNKEAKDTDIFFFSDAAKITGDESIDVDCKEKVQCIRDYLQGLDGFNSVKIIYRDHNVGLAENIISGVTSVINEYGSAIVLEDDLLVSSAFISYMNEALARYKDQENVYSISAYSFLPHCRKNIKNSQTYFLPITCSWAWATWDDKWEKFDKDAQGWEILNYDKVKRSVFNFEDTVDYYSMLKAQMSGGIESWAIRWYWSVFNHQGLTLYPIVSYVDNEGFDGSGVHTKGAPPGGSKRDLNTCKNIIFPEDCKIDNKTCNRVKKSLKNKKYIRIITWIKNIVG